MIGRVEISSHVKGSLLGSLYIWGSHIYSLSLVPPWVARLHACSVFLDVLWYFFLLRFYDHLLSTRLTPLSSPICFFGYPAPHYDPRSDSTNVHMLFVLGGHTALDITISTNQITPYSLYHSSTLLRPMFVTSKTVICMANVHMK